MGIFFATLAFALASMLLIESISPPWRKAIGGLILFSIVIAGLVPEH